MLCHKIKKFAYLLQKYQIVNFIKDILIVASVMMIIIYLKTNV